jgi:hypothetical protein
LLHSGWAIHDDCDDFLSKDGLRVFRANALSAPRSYLLCMVSCRRLFGKPGGLNRIWHRGPDAYFSLLLSLPDLSRIADMSDEDLQLCTNTQFQQMHKGIFPDGVIGFVPFVPALADASGEDDVGGPPPPDAAGPPSPPLPLPVPPAHAAPAGPLHVLPPARPPIDSILVGVPPMRIYFDNFSHQSGNSRAFTYCADHTKCRLYVFTKDFVTVDRCASYLFAWRMLSAFFPDESDGAAHVNLKPDDASVADVERQQFG